MARYRKRNPKVHKMKKIMRKGKAKGMLAMIRQVASKVLQRKAETKYVAQALITDTVVPNTIISNLLLTTLPRLDAGVQSNQRTGARISNIRGRTIFTFWIDNAQSPNCNNIFVKLFFLQSKQIKDYTKAGSLTPGTLLDNGDGTTTDWSNPVAGFPFQYNQMPISNENFRGRTKTLRLVKNTGEPNAIGGDVVSPNTYGKISCTYIHHWYRKAPAIYENGTGSGSQFPTNFAPLWSVVAFQADSSHKSDGEVYMTVRNEMYFKDV